MKDLRSVVIVDYQNVHLTGHGLFLVSRHGAKHEALIDPLLFAGQLIRTRNRAQQPGRDPAVLSRVLVYRGLPSADNDPESYARNLAQKAHWERDTRVRVQHRPLKYDYQRDEQGLFATDAGGKRLVRSKKEKGIDVLCALAVVRETADPHVDLVILASHDSDLEPALDEALRLGSAKLETVNWYDPTQPHRCQQLRPSDRAQRLWNTRLGESEFRGCWDVTDYT